MGLGEPNIFEVMFTVRSFRSISVVPLHTLVYIFDTVVREFPLLGMVGQAPDSSRNHEYKARSKFLLVFRASCALHHTTVVEVPVLPNQIYLCNE